jgi:hypothetical protein
VEGIDVGIIDWRTGYAAADQTLGTAIEALRAAGLGQHADRMAALRPLDGSHERVSGMGAALAAARRAMLDIWEDAETDRRVAQDNLAPDRNLLYEQVAYLGDLCVIVEAAGRALASARLELGGSDAAYQAQFALTVAARVGIA